MKSQALKRTLIKYIWSDLPFLSHAEVNGYVEEEFAHLMKLYAVIVVKKP